MSATLTTTYETTCPARSDTDILRLKGTPESIQAGSLTIIPVIVQNISAFGAEVSGVDWDRPISSEIVKQVRYLCSTKNKNNADRLEHIAG